MKFRALVIPAVLLVVLVGCTPEPDASPVASPSAHESAPSDAPSPTPTPTTAQLVIPGGCEALVAIEVVHSEFSPQFGPKAFVLHPEDEVGQSFADRNGLNCLWTIPRSEAFVGMHVAVRGPDSDAEQIAQWQSASLTECPAFLDACFYEQEETMVGTMWTVYALVDGFELRATTSAGSLDPLLALTREAAANMGYN